MKKILIISFVAIIIITLAIFEQIHFWKTDPESVCNGGGGFWGPVGCENLCDKSKAGYDCTQKFGHMDCTCGRYDNQCWDGKACVPIKK